MDLSRELWDLAGAQARGPVLSLYLDTRWADEEQRERVRIFWRDQRREVAPLFSGEEARRIFARVDAGIDALIEQHADNLPGVAWFIGGGIDRFLWLPDGVPLEASVDRLPHLLSLARLVDRCERILVAVVDAKRAHVYEVMGRQVLSELGVERQDFPGRHHQGGFAQPRFQRHIREHLRWELDDAAERLTFLADRAPGRIFLAGPHEVSAALEALLPKRVAARVQGAISVPLGSSHGQERARVIEEVGRALRARQGAETLQIEERIYREAMSGRLGTLGVQATLLALQEGRVHLLLLRDGVQSYGWRCARCQAIDARSSVSCLYCGGPILLGSTIEDIVHRALQLKTLVRVVDQAPRFPMVGGISALLRPRRARVGAPAVGQTGFDHLI